MRQVTPVWSCVYHGAECVHVLHECHLWAKGQSGADWHKKEIAVQAHVTSRSWGEDAESWPTALWAEPCWRWRVSTSVPSGRSDPAQMSHLHTSWPQCPHLHTEGGSSFFLLGHG